MKEKESKVTQEELQDALDLLNSTPVYRDLETDRQKRLEASEIIKRWTSQGSLDENRSMLITEALGGYNDVSDMYDHGSIFPRHTNPISPTSGGTGLVTQTKTPRDLRDKE